MVEVRGVELSSREGYNSCSLWQERLRLNFGRNFPSCYGSFLAPRGAGCLAAVLRSPLMCSLSVCLSVCSRQAKEGFRG